MLILTDFITWNNNRGPDNVFFFFRSSTMSSFFFFNSFNIFIWTRRIALTTTILPCYGILMNNFSPNWVGFCHHPLCVHAVQAWPNLAHVATLLFWNERPITLFPSLCKAIKKTEEPASLITQPNQTKTKPHGSAIWIFFYWALSKTPRSLSLSRLISLSTTQNITVQNYTINYLYCIYRFMVDISKRL